MEYVDASGREFVLPKLTVAVSEAMHEAADANVPVRERVARQLKFCKSSLPSAYVFEVCDGKTAETVDVAKLGALFNAVRAAYEAPAAEAAMESARAQLDAIAPLLEAYRAVQSLPRQHSRQGFNRVR